MKTISLAKKSILSAVIIASTLGISLPTLADSSSSANRGYSDKRPSEQYWSEFKQDSKQTWKDTRSAFKDGWIEGKLETAIVLNKYLSAFEIDISVDNNTATLGGEVSTPVEKELAENVALGIEGIDSVNNNIKVNSKYESKKVSTKRSVSDYLDDVSTTAAIKTELLASSNVKGLAINVDTYQDVVTLEGSVETGAQKDLAESIASKHSDVKKVMNKLTVKNS